MRSLRRFAVALAAALVIAVCIGSAGANHATAELVILATSDIHGRTYPIYYDDGSLAQASTYATEVRARNPHVLLVDNGDCLDHVDTVSPYRAYYDCRATDPVIRAMNAMDYDSMTLGNHEFNRGIEALAAVLDQARFPVISADIEKADGTPHFLPYVIRDFGPFKAGILGITTPMVSVWEKPETIGGLRFTDPVAAAKTYVPEMKTQGADVIIIVAHTGWERAPKNSSRPEAWSSPDNWTPTGKTDANWTLRLANEVPDVDVVIAGHDHLAVPEVKKMGDIVTSDVVITEPGRWGEYVSRVDVGLRRQVDGWEVSSRSATIVPMKGVAPDPRILIAARHLHNPAIA